MDFRTVPLLLKVDTHLKSDHYDIEIAPAAAASSAKMIVFVLHGSSGAAADLMC